MSRMRTSSASFSWARPAMRRACSSGVRVSSSPLGIARSVAAVEAELRDRTVDCLGDQLVDRLAVSHSLTHVAGGHGRRIELERDDAVAVALEIRRGVARARADG